MNVGHPESSFASLDGAVLARVAQRQSVVAGAQGEGEGGQGPGALRKQRQDPGRPLTAGGKIRRPWTFCRR